MDLGELRTEVRYILGETTADFWTDAELTSALNEAVRRINQAENWPWLITEVTNGLLETGDPELLLQEGVSFNRHINFLLTPNGETNPIRPPKRVSPSEGFNMRFAYASSSGDPAYYYVVSATDPDVDNAYVVTANFLPTPQRDYDVAYQYFRSTTVMVDDVDIPDLPVDYHMAVVHDGAAQRWLKELGPSSNKAAEQFELRNAILEQMRDEWINEADDTYLVAGGSPPQNVSLDDDAYARLRMPTTLSDS